jgi:hypothetical protein
VVVAAHDDIQCPFFDRGRHYHFGHPLKWAALRASINGSLIWTKLISGEPQPARKMSRPIRPNPLMPTRIVMIFGFLFCIGHKMLEQNFTAKDAKNAKFF